MKRLARVLGTLLIVAGITLFYFFVFKGANSATIAMTFLLATLAVATAWGLLEAIVASVAGVFCFNFFFLPPLFTLYMADPQNWVALFAFLVTAVVASQLSASARQRALDATRQRAEMERLLRKSASSLLLSKSLLQAVAVCWCRTFWGPISILETRSNSHSRATEKP